MESMGIATMGSLHSKPQVWDFGCCLIKCATFIHDNINCCKSHLFLGVCCCTKGRLALESLHLYRKGFLYSDAALMKHTSFWQFSLAGMSAVTSCSI